MSSIPLTAIRDPNIQLWPHTAQTGTKIGGCAPVSFGTLLSPPGSPTARLFYAQGSSVPGGYADVLFSPPTRPVLPNTGNVAFALAFMVDQNTAKYSQAREFDLKLSLGGYLYNFSHQCNDAEGGHEQVTNAQGQHVDIGLNPGLPTPDVWHYYQFICSFDAVKHVSSFVSVSLDGAVGMVPPALLNQPGTPTDWPEGAYLQTPQLDQNALAGGFSVAVDELTLIWW